MDKIGVVKKEISQLKSKIEDLSAWDYASNRKEIEKLRRRMEELLYKGELMWMQRSRVAKEIVT
jgi:hypothetical protein